MAGIYIHIPFCKQACHYCDFHFSVNTERKAAMIEAIVQELRLQHNYLGNETVNTVYLGGGTPSLLSETELVAILNACYQSFEIAPGTEITLEANPDDLSHEKLLTLRSAGVNRLSVGIQSFHDPHLQYLNRAHSAEEAVRSIRQAQDIGFDNISLDLIYSIPSSDHTIWESDLAIAMALQPQHISSYALTIEEKTVFGRQQRRGVLPKVDENFTVAQFERLLKVLNEHGYEQYEVSNFCQPNYESQHNSNYWRRQPYLGVGPSAHSYNRESRQFNVASNGQYFKALAENCLTFEREVLSSQDQINEYIMTGLRTKWGCDLHQVKEEFGYDLYRNNQAYIKQLLAHRKAVIQKGHLILTKQGLLLADGIAANLFCS